MSTLAPHFIVLAALCTFGCKEQFSNYCPDALHHNCLNVDDAGNNLCTSDQQCAPNICDLTGSKMCVQCTSSNPAACTGTTPLCGTDNACHGCTAHAQCSSNVCLADGSCAPEASVAYVAQGGSDSTCRKLTPCGTLQAAVQTDRSYVKVAAGLIKDAQMTTIDSKTVTILADVGAKLDRDGDGPILVVQSTSAAGANVQIFDLEITGATGAPGGDGIRLTANGGTPSLGLTRVTIDGNQGTAVTTAGGSLTISRSTVSGNTGGGIAMSADGIVSITNTFIYRNGNTLTASAGGLSLKPTGASKIEFNTIVDNLANANSISAGGIFCDQTGFVAANNIIFRNAGGTTGVAQTVGSCMYGNSINRAGATAVDNSLGFLNPNTQPFDYHLSATSPSTVVDAARACTGVDFDGDSRPIGAACDLGADEYHP